MRKTINGYVVPRKDEMLFQKKEEAKLSDFIPIKKIGSGGFSSVKLGKFLTYEMTFGIVRCKKTGNLFALKSISKRKIKEQQKEE